MDGPPETDLCSVCRENFTIPCQSNCSHWFCTNCIMLIWHHESILNPIKCPLCRRHITLFVPSNDSVRQQNDDPEVAEVLNKIKKYNRLFSEHPRSVVQKVQDLPFLLRHLLIELLNPQRSLPLVIRTRVYVAMILTGLYITSPIWTVSKRLWRILSIFDDILIVLILCMYVASVYRSELHRRYGTRS